MLQTLNTNDVAGCTPDERKALLKLARICDVPVFNSTPQSDDEYPNLIFTGYHICGNSAQVGSSDFSYNWVTAEEFAFKILGDEYIVGITLEEILNLIDK